jgi:tripartite-type tricarboxylate transporter receptor subunit TctC
MKEVGFDGVGTIAWQGLFAPAGTPQAVIDKLYKDVTKTLQSPEVIAKFGKQHFNIVPNSSPAEAKTWLAGEMKHWQTITSEVKLTTAH